jgi:hypothetical protein
MNGGRMPAACPAAWAKRAGAPLGGHGPRLPRDASRAEGGR